MAAPLRPSVRNTNTERVYQSVDAVDQQLYNDLRFLYEKAAFLAFIDKSGKCKACVALTNGITVQAEWNRHGATYVRDWRTRRRLLRPPGNNPLPPVGQVMSQPAIPQPTTPGAAQTQIADEAEFSLHSGQHSPVTLAGGSPRFVLANDPDADRYVRFSPTRGQRAHVEEFLGSTDWKFVKVLYQTELDNERAQQAINPSKSINLYVRNVNGIIGEFAQFGALYNLASAHNSQETPVPEHFIWHFLSQMTEALLAFQTGTCDEPRPEERVTEGDAAPAAAGWEALLHSDIKLENVFCCQENTVYPAYPRIVLADFDLAQSVRKLTSRYRYAGTRTTQPPERNAYALGDSDDDSSDELAYAPGEWDISEKSDIWGIGIIAYLLLSAGSTQNSYARAQEKMAVDAKAWVHDFATTDVEHHPTGSFLTDEMDNFSDIHSLGLIRLVNQCLQYRPADRPTLQDMKYKIDANIERLDRMYGDEIKKKGKAIASEHTVLYGQNNKRRNEFNIGNGYEPPRKRQRIHLTAQQATEYRTLVDSWADTTRYPRPDSASQTNLVRTIDHAVGNSQDEEITKIYDNDSLRHAYNYMLSCMRYRLDEDATFSWYTEWNDDLQKSFTQKNKVALLRHLHKILVSKLLNDSHTIELEHAIRAFEHALEWALFLLEKQGEPLTPVLDEKTQIHRALRDWIFVHPYSRAK
ncbi:kinase-like domain-containing protein [Ampelomyces quisqualis]|uniref:Kinase-like domain-containing protein n=1 Tax=Ampelomyces quisqualis TaxID=50730 RepID=A0A6A5QJI1_AMPQU|nr:kinase-like domain-containing protein [Ampelomyces quisqualis]